MMRGREERPLKHQIFDPKYSPRIIGGLVSLTPCPQIVFRVSSAINSSFTSDPILPGLPRLSGVAMHYKQAVDDQ